MAIIRAAVGDKLKAFDESADLTEVWAFVDEQMKTSDEERGIVLMDTGGETLAQIWDRSLYFAHWETPAKMRAYLDLAGFDSEN